MVEEGDAPGLGVEEGELEIRSGEGDDESRDSPTGPEIEDAARHAGQPVDETLRVGDVVLDRARPQGTEVACLVENPGQVLRLGIGVHGGHSAHSGAVCPMPKDLFHVKHVEGP